MNRSGVRISSRAPVSAVQFSSTGLVWAGRQVVEPVSGNGSGRGCDVVPAGAGIGFDLVVVFVDVVVAVVADGDQVGVVGVCRRFPSGRCGGAKLRLASAPQPCNRPEWIWPGRIRPGQGENLIAVSIPAPSDNNPLNILEKHKKYYKYLENNDKSYKQLNNSQHSPSRLEGVEADRIGLPTPKFVVTGPLAPSAQPSERNSRSSRAAAKYSSAVKSAVPRSWNRTVSITPVGSHLCAHSSWSRLHMIAPNRTSMSPLSSFSATSAAESLLTASTSPTSGWASGSTGGRAPAGNKAVTVACMRSASHEWVGRHQHING